MVIERLLPDVVVENITTSCSSRNGATELIIVIHTTEGLMRLGDRARWWDTVDASAHVGVGHQKFGQDGKSARYVRDADKAWTQRFYNPWSLSVEIEGFAATPERDWPESTVREVARWIAHWSIQCDIPIQTGDVSLDGRILQRGVVSHRRLGHLGGDHHDPGNFPMDEAKEIARQIKHERLERR